MNPDTKLPAAAPAHPTAVIGVMLSTDWPELAPRGPLRVLTTSNPKWAAHMLSLPGGKVEEDDHFLEPDSFNGAHNAILREIWEEVGVMPGCMSVGPVWEGWQPGPPIHYVRAYRVRPSYRPGRDPQLRVETLKAEEGARLVWIEPHLLEAVCPYANTNMPAIRAACGMVEQEPHER